MLRRSAVKKIVLLGGSIAAVGGSAVGWKYFQLTKNPDWASFEKHQDVLAALTETILPTTDTPGAIATGVPAYVQYMVRTNLDVKTQNKFIKGLVELSEYCLSNFGKPFTQCTNSEKDQVLGYFEKQAHSYNALVEKARNLLTGKSFYTVLRNLTIVGYCTSEIGINRSLAYDYIPGGFQGCLPYQKGQKSWATQ